LAFFRFSRDNRGYEHFSLVQPMTNRRGKVRQRVLYWFRTPPNVRVGREPFDEAVRRQLEKQNPDVTFDWPGILETPIPSADADKWRERRRVERAARQAAAEDESAEAIAGDLKSNAADPTPQPAAIPELPIALTAEPNSTESVAAASGPVVAPSAGSPSRKRRRRRRGRRGGPEAQPGQPTELRAPDGPRDSIEPAEPDELDAPREPGEPAGD
jgi:hypothetical protein